MYVCVFFADRHTFVEHVHKIVCLGQKKVRRRQKRVLDFFANEGEKRLRREALWPFNAEAA